MRDEGVGIAGKDYSYSIWVSHAIYQTEGLKEYFFPSKRKVSKEGGGQTLATLLFPLTSGQRQWLQLNNLQLKKSSLITSLC